MTQALSILATIFNLSSGLGYFKQVLKGESTPNPATWFIWVIVTLINGTTYFLVVEKSLWISMIYVMSALVVVSVFVVSLSKGKFTALRSAEGFSLVLAVMVGILWKLTGNPIIANVCLQVILIISFYPTLNGLLKGVAKERPAPWLLASISYIFQIINIFLNHITLWALVSPVVNIAGQGTIGLVAYYQNKRSQR